MSDVQDANSSFTDQLRQIFLYLKNFLKNPLQEISYLPNWPWIVVLYVQVGLSMISGAIAGLITFNNWKVLQGVFLFPIVSTIIGLVLSSFFYYYFQVFEKKTVSYLKLTTLVFISYAPFYIFYIPSDYFAVSSLFGMAFTGMLLVVGLHSNFGLEKRRAIRMVGILFLLVFILWGYEKIRNMRMDRSAEQQMSDM